VFSAIVQNTEFSVYIILLVKSVTTILGTNGLNSADVPLSNKQTNELIKLTESRPKFIDIETSQPNKSTVKHKHSLTLLHANEIGRRPNHVQYLAKHVFNNALHA